MQVREGRENAIRRNRAVGRAVGVSEVNGGDPEGAVGGIKQAFWGVDVQ